MKDLYTRITRKITRISKECKEFMEYLDNTIPEKSCDKDNLFLIAAAHDIGNSKELEYILKTQIKHIKGFAGCLHKLEQKEYENMLKAVKEIPVTQENSRYCQHVF